MGGCFNTSTFVLLDTSTRWLAHCYILGQQYTLHQLLADKCEASTAFGGFHRQGLLIKAVPTLAFDRIQLKMSQLLGEFKGRLLQLSACDFELSTVGSGFCVGKLREQLQPVGRASTRIRGLMFSVV